ncbi:lysophospholipase [Gracilibacillus boraciitolerans JCM 21714]|uniref:Lysophospholipase n=1 Tax=Gracilibacillus boraciitolerans JCM 21714 TaxID=1298598 RepID=W4VHZ5_9BACI|nr:alpha/beta fold hydrolase [Gracilibacillus boraciitolerans]GAE92791.1 lysophospholipase [Gracilibacillus boraciitolerans JCM 21714]
MDEESFWFHTKDKQELFVKCWKKTDKPKAIILIAHGMAEHIERYNEVASYFADHHFIVYGHDHRGHGKTGQLAESLGFFAEKDGFDLVVQDLMELTTFIKEKHPNIPIFLIGHSMGSFICRRYMMLNGDNLNGVILIGTGFQSPLLLKAAKKIAKYMVKIKGKRTASPHF